MKTDLAAAMSLLGFQILGTGGGCTTFCRQFNGEEWCITEESGCHAPEGPFERVWLSRMKAGEILYESRQRTLLDALFTMGYLMGLDGIRPCAACHKKPEVSGLEICPECRAKGIR